MKRILAIGVILLFIGMSISSSTGFNVEKQSTISLNGKTLYVGGSGPGNYTKIQDAIDNASNGDTVFVYNDSSPYYEYNIEITKSINLIGENRYTTVINSNISIETDWANISGFTIQNGHFGLFLRGNYNSITNNIITNNYILNPHIPFRPMSTDNPMAIIMI